MLERVRLWAVDNLRAGLSDLWKDIRKWLFRLLAFGLFGYLVKLVYNYFDVEQPPALDELPGFLAEQFLAYPATAWKWLVALPSEKFVAFFTDSTTIAVAGLTLFSGYLTLFILLRRAKRRLDSQSDALKRGSTYKALLDSAGLTGWWPHAKVDGTGGAPWQDLRDEIMQPGNNEVCILGANGIDTFGGPNAPLYDTLSKYAGTVRIILVDPKSPHVKGRAEALGMTEGEYVKALRTSVARLQDLRSQQHSVDGRYYDGQPNWKMIITSRTIWIQYYRTGGPHVDQTPVFRFETPNGFYEFFRMEFDRIWGRCQASPMTLAVAAPRPNPNRKSRRKGRR